MSRPVFNKKSVTLASLGFLARLGLLFVFVFSIVAGCSQMKGTRRPISDGDKLFRSKCRSCHILPKKDEKKSDEWPIFLSAHTKDKAIAPEDLEKIVQFLQSAQ